MPLRKWIQISGQDVQDEVEEMYKIRKVHGRKNDLAQHNLRIPGARLYDYRVAVPVRIPFSPTHISLEYLKEQVF